MLLNFTWDYELRKASTLRGQSGCMHFLARIAIFAGIKAFKGKVQEGKITLQLLECSVVIYLIGHHFYRDVSLQEEKK